MPATFCEFRRLIKKGQIRKRIHLSSNTIKIWILPCAEKWLLYCVPQIEMHHLCNYAKNLISFSSNSIVLFMDLRHQLDGHFQQDIAMDYFMKFHEIFCILHDMLTQQFIQDEMYYIDNFVN